MVLGICDLHILSLFRLWGPQLFSKQSMLGLLLGGVSENLGHVEMFLSEWVLATTFEFVVCFLRLRFLGHC